LEVGNLIEQVFPLLGIRFVSVSDCFDSNLNNGAAGAIDIGFKNLINDLYSKDLSKKITSARRAKAAQGKFVTAFAPYGYVKSKCEKNTLLIDEECAVIVRRIYQMAVDGVSKTAIARQLNAENIPSPITMRRIRNDNYKSWCANEKCHWATPAISHILNDRRYTGVLVYGKVKPSAVGSGTEISAPEDEWIITPNAHPAIVSNEMFETAQNMKRTHKYKRGIRSPLSGKIKCSVCNRAFIKKSGYDLYFCRTHSFTDTYKCFAGKLSATLIESAILAELNIFLQLCEKARQEPNVSKKETLSQTPSALLRKIASLKNKRLMNYEHYKEKKIPKEIFLLKRRKLENDISLTEEQIKTKEYAGSVLRDINGYGSFETLTKKIVGKFVKKIVVDESGNMQIHWDFSCPFEHTAVQF
jgi:hypothetical protein